MKAPVGYAFPRTAKPVAAGILDIVAGSICLLSIIGMGIGAAVFAPLCVFPFAFTWLVGLVALIPAALGIISIIGGIFALQRRAWGWALAGSITTICLSNLLGIASLILTVLSKNEFEN